MEVATMLAHGKVGIRGIPPQIKHLKRVSDLDKGGG